MSRRLSAYLAVMIAVSWCAAARADLCEKCSRLMFTESAGTCVSCGGPTTSGALKLCPKCSAKLHRCEHCLAALDGAAGPLPDTPVKPQSPDQSAPATPGAWVPSKPAPSTPAPGTPAITTPTPAAPAPAAAEAVKPLDPNKPGTYVAGRWQYTLQITDQGTRNEGRQGWLFFDGKKPPRGLVNDYYRTPWGPIYWVDVPSTRAGLHGWMSIPSPAVKRPGRELALPIASAAKPSPPQSRWFEISKADSGKRARVAVGQFVLIRLPGNLDHRLWLAGGRAWWQVGTIANGAAIRRRRGQARHGRRRRHVLLQVSGGPTRHDNDQAGLRSVVGEESTAGGHIYMHRGGAAFSAHPCGHARPTGGFGRGCKRQRNLVAHA